MLAKGLVGKVSLKYEGGLRYIPGAATAAGGRPSGLERAPCPPPGFVGKVSLKYEGEHRYNSEGGGPACPPQPSGVVVISNEIATTQLI